MCHLQVLASTCGRLAVRRPPIHVNRWTRSATHIGAACRYQGYEQRERRIRYATDATSELRANIAEVGPERLRAFLAVVASLQDALPPPTGRPWWLG